MDDADLPVVMQGSKVVAIVDQDPKSASVRTSFVRECEKLGIPCTRLEKYSIENYFTTRGYRAVFKGQIPDELNAIDPSVKFETQLGFDPKKKSWNLAREMTLDELEGTDLDGFLDEVARICEI